MGTVIAQSTTEAAKPSATSMVISGGQHDGQLIAGQHVGAAHSYQVILSERTGNSLGAGGDQYLVNETGNQLMDESLVADIPLPCYVINATEISDNAGPLECGVLVDEEPHNTINLGDDWSVFFFGVQSWWVCDVNATQPYGIIPGTVVGGFTTSEPSGPGIRNCSAVEALKLGNGSGTQNSSSTSSMTSSSSSAAASSSATGTQTNTLTTDRKTAMASPTSTSSQATNSGSASATTAPGAASHNMMHDVSKVGMLMAGGLALLL